MLRRLLLAPLVVGLAACSPLALFDGVVPKDRGSQRVARDLAFGAGPRQKLDLYAPGKPASQRLPVIVWFYGGSWNSGDKRVYGFAGRALAAEGFLVAVPDYRLVPEVRFPTFIEDGAAAVRWVRANAARYGGDPDRIVLAGHSAGAYNAAMLSLDPQWLGADRKAVKGFAGLAGPYDFLPLSGPATTAAFGQAPDKAATQPISFARAGSPPAFLATGADDTLVRPRNSVVLAQRLAAAGVAAEARLYPKIGHVGILTALSRPARGRAPVLRDLADFARRVTAEERPFVER
jgi:acetyl esterase/lipase